MTELSIFSAEALKARRSKPLQLPAYFLRLPTAFAIAIVFASTAAGLLWAVLARIPIKVPGRAVVVNVNDIKPLITRSSGKIAIIPPSISATRYTLDKELFNFYTSKSFTGNIQDLFQVSELLLEDSAPNQLQNYTKLVRNAALLKEISSSKFAVTRGQVVAIVFNEDSRTDLANKVINAREEFETNELAIKRTKANVASLKQQLSRQHKIVESYRSLQTAGAATDLDLMQALQQYTSLNMQISDNNNNIDQMVTKNESITSELQSSISEYISNQYVFAESDGYISDLSKGNEQYSDVNQPILFFSSQPTSHLPSWIIGFTDDRSANLISDGMQVLATPLGVNKSQYGGIRGTISTKLPYSITSAKLASIVGMDSVANASSVSTSTPNLIVIKLSMDSTGTSYKWISNQTPPTQTGVGDVLDLDIEVEKQSPLLMSIPFLKKYLGLEGPTEFTSPR
jgi:hypothetical protein